MTAPARKANYHSHSQSPSFLLEGETLDLCHNHAPQFFRPNATLLSECVAEIPQPVPESGTGTNSSKYGIVLWDSLTISAMPKWLNEQAALQLDRIWRLEIAPAHLIGILAGHQRDLSGAEFGQQPEDDNQPDQAHLAALTVGNHQPDHAEEHGEQHNQSAQRYRAILQYRPDHSGPPALVESHNAWMTLWQMLEATSGIFFGVFPKSVGRFA